MRTTCLVLTFLYIFFAVIIISGLNNEYINSDNEDNLKIGTFNIRFYEPSETRNRWEDRNKLIYKVLSVENIDINGLQEVYTHSHSENRKNIQLIWLLKKNQDYYILVNNETRSLSSALPILVKKDKFLILDNGQFFFNDNPLIIPSHNNGYFTVFYCDWIRARDIKSGKTFYVYNIHLGSRSKNKENTVNIILKQISKRNHKEDGIILLGDFNMFYNSKYMKLFYKFGLVNSIPSLLPGT